jgi:hypothetical protein
MPAHGLSPMLEFHSHFHRNAEEWLASVSYEEGARAHHFIGAFHAALIHSFELPGANSGTGCPTAR